MLVRKMARDIPHNISELKTLLLKGINSSIPDYDLVSTTRGTKGDFDLNQAAFDKHHTPDLKLASVLVPIVTREHGAQVLLTRRAEHLSKHSGQIAFPGGKVDTSDASPTAAALREAHEEIGLKSEAVEVLGFLDTYETWTGFLILPVIGLVNPNYTMSINAAEVAEVFEVPLHFLMNRDNHQLNSRDWDDDFKTYYYAMSYEGRYIWGVTAGMLRNLSERVF